MISQKQVDYAVEVDAIMQVFILIAADAKAGKPPTQILADVAPQFLSALTGISQVASEISANKKVVEETVAYGLGKLVAALS